MRDLAVQKQKPENPSSAENPRWRNHPDPAALPNRFADGLWALIHFNTSRVGNAMMNLGGTPGHQGGEGLGKVHLITGQHTLHLVAPLLCLSCAGEAHLGMSLSHVPKKGV